MMNECRWCDEYQKDIESLYDMNQRSKFCGICSDHLAKSVLPEGNKDDLFANLCFYGTAVPLIKVSAPKCPELCWDVENPLP